MIARYHDGPNSRFLANGNGVGYLDSWRVQDAHHSEKDKLALDVLAVPVFRKRIQETKRHPEDAHAVCGELVICSQEFSGPSFVQSFHSATDPGLVAQWNKRLDAPLGEGHEGRSATIHRGTYHRGQ